MKGKIILLLVALPLMIAHAETKLSNKNTSENESKYLKDETLESCYEKTVSVAVQNCLGYLADEKKEAYNATFNQFIKDIHRVRKYFYDYNLFTKLTKRNKLYWDRYIKSECLAEATLNEKGGYGYSFVYDACLIESYEKRIKFYNDYRYKITSLSPAFSHLFKDE